MGIDDPLSMSNFEREGRVLAGGARGMAGNEGGLADFEVEDLGRHVSRLCGGSLSVLDAFSSSEETIKSSSDDDRENDEVS